MEGVRLLWGGGQGAKHLGVGLGELKTFYVAVTGKEAIKGLHFIIGLQVSELLDVICGL